MPTPDLSPGQLAAFAAYVIALTLWMFSLFIRFYKVVALDTLCVEGVASPSVHQQLLEHDKKETVQSPSSAGTAHTPDGERSSGRTPKRSIRNGIFPCLFHSSYASVLCLDRTAVATHASGIAAAAEFGTLMLWFFLADRTTLFPFMNKSYSRDVFLVVFLAISAVAL